MHEREKIDPGVCDIIVDMIVVLVSVITLRIAHLRIAHWGAIPRWAILSPSVIRIAHPDYYVFLWIVCARYGPWVNAGDYASVFNHNILKNKVIHAITGDIWKRSVERSQTNVPNETLQAIWELVWKHKQMQTVWFYI